MLDVIAEIVFGLLGELFFRHPVGCFGFLALAAAIGCAIFWFG